MAFHWRGDDGPTLNAGLVAIWFSGDPKKPYIFVIFQGVRTPCLPSGSARVLVLQVSLLFGMCMLYDLFTMLLWSLLFSESYCSSFFHYGGYRFR